MTTRAEEIFNRMNTTKRGRSVLESVPIHNNTEYEGHSEEDTEDAMDESKGPLEESGATHTSDSEGEVEESVNEEMNRFEASFKNFTMRYRLINRIGEGVLFDSTKDDSAY